MLGRDWKEGQDGNEMGGMRETRILSCPSEMSYSCRDSRRQYFTPVGLVCPLVRPSALSPSLPVSFTISLSLSLTLLKEFLRSLSIFNHSSTFHCQWRHLRLVRVLSGVLCVGRWSLSASFVSTDALFVRALTRTSTYVTWYSVREAGLQVTWVKKLSQLVKIAFSCRQTRETPNVEKSSTF